MKTKFTTLNVVTTAMLAAVAVIMASAFHAFGDMTISSLFSPMHFPVLLCGILCGPYLGLICGVVTPLMSFLSTGGARPPFPTGLIPMIAELAVYGFLTGLMRWVFTKNPKTNRIASILALVIAMVAGRLFNAVVGAIVLAIASGNPILATFAQKFIGNFTSTWAGIILQIVLIPAILFALQKSGILLKYIPDNSSAQSDTTVSGEQQTADGVENS